MPARRVTCAPCALLAVAACLVAGTPRGSSASALRRALLDSSADSFPKYYGYSHGDACEHAARAIEHCDEDDGDPNFAFLRLRCVDGLIQDMGHEPFDLAVRSCDEAFQGERDRLQCLVWAVEGALCRAELVGGDSSEGGGDDDGDDDDDEQPPPAPPASWHDGDRYDYFEKTSCHQVSSSGSGWTSLAQDAGPFYFDRVRGVANRKDCQAHCDSRGSCGAFTHTSSHDCFLFSDDCHDPHFPVDYHFSARKKDHTWYGPPLCGDEETTPRWQEWHNYQCAGSPHFTLREGDPTWDDYDYESSADYSVPYSGSLEDCQQEVVNDYWDHNGNGSIDAGSGTIVVYDRAARRCEFYTWDQCWRLAPASSSGAVSTHLYCNWNS